MHGRRRGRSRPEESGGWLNDRETVTKFHVDCAPLWSTCLPRTIGAPFVSQTLELDQPLNWLICGQTKRQITERVRGATRVITSSRAENVTVLPGRTCLHYPFSDLSLKTSLGTVFEKPAVYAILLLIKTRWSESIESLVRCRGNAHRALVF